jgi:hypothetical protein
LTAVLGSASCKKNARRWPASALALHSYPPMSFHRAAVLVTGVEKIGHSIWCTNQRQVRITFKTQSFGHVRNCWNASSVQIDNPKMKRCLFPAPSCQGLSTLCNGWTLQNSEAES